MPPKKVAEPERKPLIGRVGTNLRVGIVGIPNVGKSTFFNVLTKSAVAASNFPFCTIDPNENKYISGMKYEEESFNIPVATEWFPRCNSYYPYTEDVDAINRVHHLVASKQFLASFTNLQAETKTKDEHNTYEARVAFLKSSPATFIILGKPGIGEQQLGKLLADHWKCVYIDPKILVDEEIKSGSRAGQCIEFNLRCGRAIAVDVILRLLQKRVNSKSARHRGFVVCGFPLIRNDMYQDDPVSSESAVFTAQEMFEEMLEPVLASPLASRNVSKISDLSKVSDVSLSKDAVVESTEQDFEETEGERDTEDEEIEKEVPARQNVSVDVGSTTSNICRISNIGTNYSEQLMFVFSLCHQPLIILYLMCQDTDVINKHQSYRYDMRNQELLNLQRDQSENIVYTIFTKTPGFSNEELPDDFLDGLGERSLGLNSSELKYLIYLPSDFAGNIAAQLESYRYEALPMIEKRVLVHDPQYFIKLDGRISPYRMFNIVKTKLRVLPIPRVALPTQLIDEFVPTGGEDDQIDEIDYEGKSPEECFEDFRKKKTVNRMFKWKWSKWAALCPVAMTRGVYVPGNPKYAVSFLDRIYFLSSDDAVRSFMRNPRPYLLPPAPKLACKIFIIGPRTSGKSAVANCLGLLLNGRVLDPFRLQQEYIAQKKKEFLDKVRTEAINAALILLEEAKKAEYDRLEHLRLDNIPIWLSAQITLIEERLLLARLMQVGTITLETTAFPLKSVQKKEIEPEVMAQYRDQYDTLRQKFIDVGLTCFSDIDLCEAISADPTKLNELLPEELKNPTPQPDPPNVFDEFVTEYADAAVDKAFYDTFEMSTKDIVDMFTIAVKEAEQKNADENHGGWIIDGVPADVALVGKLLAKCKPDEVYLLRDANKTFLLDRYRIKGNNQFRDYKQFFEKVGKPQVALKCPSLTSTMSYKARIARNIVDEILDHEEITGEDFVPEAEAENDEFVDVDYFATHATRFALKQYEKDLDEFEIGCEDLVNYLTTNDITYAEFDVGDKSLSQLMNEVIKHCESKFCLKAHELTPAEILQEIEDFGEPEIPGEDAGEGEEEPKTGDPTESFNKNRRLGNTNYYCPVSFHDHWILWRGKEEYTAKYDDELYFMCDEEALGNFIRCPQEYLTNEPMRSIPPPRICVVGVASCGKTTLAKYLSKSLGLYYICYDRLLNRLLRGSSALDVHLSIRLNEGSEEAVALENYLNSGEALPEHLQKKVNLKSFWFDEPIKSGGFVLDGYPKRSSDAEYMTKNKLIPDVILELSVSDVEVNKRHVQKLINEWQENTLKAQQEQDKENRKIADDWERKREQRIAELREIKRQARFKAKLQEKTDLQEQTDEETNKSRPSTVRSEVSFDSVAEQADLEDVLKEVASELPEPMFDDNWETVDEATDRIINETENSFVADMETYRLLKDYCDAELIDWVSVDANLSVHKVKVQAMRAVDKIKFRNGSFFERCYDVSPEIAEELLESGYCFSSRFGRFCPVDLYEQINPVLMFLPLEKKFEIYPVLHRSYIYFLAGVENRQKFCKNPLKYTMQSNDQCPIVSFRIAVIGPPKCGKSVLCERFKRDLGLKCVSIGQAARYVLRFLPYSLLAKKLENVLRKGWELTSEMTVLCVEAMAFNGSSITQGLVFDGFPNSIEDVRHLAEVGLVPHLVIDLQADGDDRYMCLGSDAGKRGLPAFSRKFIDHRYEEWFQLSDKFRQWFDHEYQIVAKLPIKSSKWSIWSAAHELLASTLFEIKHYYKHCNKHIGLRLANMQVTPTEFFERESSYKQYCPCCLHYKSVLVSGDDPPDRTGVVQFHSKYYWLCNEHIDEFIHNPEMYLTPYNKNKLPVDLPKRETFSERPENCFEDGVCIVCYWDNQPQRVFNEGNLTMACAYRDRIYLFDTRSCMEKFVTEPWKYFNRAVNFKQSTPFASLRLADLPVLGMLEQYVADNVVKAVVNTGVTRPVLAGLSIEQSAALNVGLHLKLHNANTPKDILPFYEKAGRLFKDRRLSLINSLARMKQTVSPYLYYEEPLSRLILPGDQKEDDALSDESCSDQNGLIN